MESKDAEVARAVERIERRIRARFPVVRQIFREARAVSEPGTPRHTSTGGAA